MSRSRLPHVLVRAAWTALITGIAAVPCVAGVYPEHRDIAMLAVTQLDTERRAQFDALWAQARTGHEPRLCAAAADTAQALTPDCIDWAAFSAISGDHSCSSADLLNTATRSDWILNVADVAAQLKVDLDRVAAQATKPQDTKKGNVVTNALEDAKRTLLSSELRAQRINALRTSDTRLQRADPQYATRAGSNNAHFLLPRPTVELDEAHYAELVASPGAELNALGIYAFMHLNALQKAARLAHEQLSGTERNELILAMLAEEAFGYRIQQMLKELNLLGGVAVLDALPKPQLQAFLKKVGESLTNTGSGPTAGAGAA